MSPSAPSTVAVIFDMDGVLVDSEHLHTRATRLLLADHGLPDWDESESDDYIGLTDVESFSKLKARHGLAGDPADYAARYAERVIAVLRAEAKPIDGVRDVLPALLARGYRLALASSSRPEVIAATLEAIGVRRLFEVVVSAAEVARGKPSPDVFLEAAKRLGVSPSECVVVEDSHNGVRAARAAGMRCVAIPCGPTLQQDFAQASVVLGALRDLLHCAVLASPPPR
jgi:HAD superfamily hydrolase (TIGR01509 family)